MRSVVMRAFLSLVVLAIPTLAIAQNVTVSGSATFPSLDGSAQDADHTSNGVFTVNGDLTVNGTIACQSGQSGCAMTFSVGRDMIVNAGGSLNADAQNGGGSGGAITMNVSRDLILKTSTASLAAALITTRSASSSSALGGAIVANASRDISIESEATLDSGSVNSTGGNISLIGGGHVDVSGRVLSGPSRTLTATRLTGNALAGGTNNYDGGAILIRSTTFTEPGTTIGSNASIISQGANGGGGTITIEGCGIVVKGLVASLSEGNIPARVVLRSGKALTIDSRDLGVAGATLGRNGMIRSESTGGDAAAMKLDVFAGGAIEILGASSPSTLFALTSMPGGSGGGGAVRVVALDGAVTASGNAVVAGRVNSGNRGGSVAISSRGNASLDTATINAPGGTSGSSRAGGSINVRSYSGSVTWTNGSGDVRPTGSSSGVTAANQGTISLTACGAVVISGSSYPTNGPAVGTWPAQQSGVCSPAAPSLPAGESGLQVCNTPPVATNGSATTNEDNAVTITMNGTDADGDALTFSIVSGPAHGALGPIFNPTPTSAQVIYTPALNYNGSDSFVFQVNDGRGGASNGTENITVNPVNDPPTFNTSADPTSLEDAGPQTVPNYITAISPGPADESSQTVAFTVTGNTNPSLFLVQPAIAPNGTLTYTAAPNANGSSSITVVANDNGGTANGGNDTSIPKTFNINVTAVNDAPSFVRGADQIANEDAGPQTVANWATAISAGPADEASQTVTFTVTTNNAALFASGPAVSSSGTLTYTTAANANGTATVSVTAHDNGGTANGGVDSSAAQSFTITVNAVNDPPSFTSGGNVTVLEDSGAYSAAWASAISPGPSDESGQLVTFSASNDNNALFSVQPSVAPNGQLSFATASNAYGTATVTVTAQDNGGGANTSAPQTFTITLTPVNDAPSFTPGASVSVNEDSGAYSAAWASAISAGPNESSQTVHFNTSNNNNGLFASQPSISASGVLSFTPAANANGSAIVTVNAQDDGGTANGGVDTSASVTFTITVIAVNDPPSFTSGGNVTVLEDSGAYSAAWASSISAGPSDENGQLVTFSASNDNNALFSVQPSVAPNGTLTFVVASNAYGSATVTVTAQDNGGTANGGNDTSAAQTFTITITPVNDAPSFTPGASVSVNEDSGAYSAAWASAISAGPNEASQVVHFNVSNDNNGLFASQPSISASGVLSFTPALNANGSATVTVNLQDNGGTANGGVDTSASVTFTITVVAVNDPPSFTKGADQTVAEDSGAQTVSGWATAISAGPADESGQTVTFTSTNDNTALFSVQPSVAPDGTLTYTPAANAFGTATVSVTAHDNGGTANGGNDTSAPQTFTITITAVNDPPSFVSGGNVSANEDSGAYSQPWATSISAGPGESGQTVSFIVSNDNNALFASQPAVSSSGVLTFTPALNAFGSATVTVTAQDDGPGSPSSAPQTFVITINPVNDPPSFTGSGDVTVAEDSGAYSAQWTTSISSGPGESNNVTFSATNNNNALFTTQPALSPSGVLTFTVATNAFGSATVTVTAHDDGGTANGGNDTSAPQTFTITVTGVNDPPSFVSGGNVSANEDSGAYSQPWATSISAGPGESGQTVSFIVSNDNNALFASQPAVSSSGVLTFTPALNAFGSATVTVTAQDDGPGTPTSAPQTFVITINPVNDPPSFTGSGDVTVAEDSGAYSAQWTTSISSGPGETNNVTFTVTNGNNSLFTSQPAISPSGVLTFTTALNAFGSAVVTVTAHDDGGTANGGNDTSAPQTFTIFITAVNDPPTFVKGADVSANDNAGAQTFPGWATSISAGPGESGQTLTFVVTNNTHPEFFSVQPAVNSTTGALTFTPAVGHDGVAVVTLVLQDNGGGSDTSAPQTFNITIHHANNPPVVANESYDTIGNTTLEVSSAQTVSGAVFVNGNLLTNDNDGGDGPSALTASFNAGTAGAVTTVNSNGSFTYMPPAGFTGTDTFTYKVFDGESTTIGTVTITVKSPRIWYVKNDGTGTSGRSHDPFQTLAQAEVASAAGDIIYVFAGNGTTSGQNAGITMKANQRLLGSGVALDPAVSVNGGPNPTVLISAGTAAKIGKATGNAVTATNVAGVEVAGLDISSSSSAVSASTSGAGSGSISVHDVNVSSAVSNGVRAVAGSSGVLTVNVTDVTITSVGNGIDARSTSGELRLGVSGATITSTGSSGIVVDGSVGGMSWITAFSNITVTGNTIAAGVFVDTARFDSIPGLSFDLVNGGTLSIGTAGNGVGGSGLLLTDVSGDLSFNNLSVVADGGAAVSATGTAVFSGAAGFRLASTTGSVTATGGSGLSATTSTLGMSLSSLTASGAASGLSLSGTSGSVSIAGGSITAMTTAGVSVSGGNTNVTYNGTITSAAGSPVVINGTTGGALSFGGAISGTAQGVSITSSASSATFSGGLTLNTVGNVAFDATNGGTVAVIGSTNTLSTTTATALNVVNTNIGAAGMTFRSITAGTAASGPANGIVLNNTGTAAGLTVAGNGSAGTGGTIQKCSSDGVSLNNTVNPNLSFMNLTNNLGSGIRGTTVNGFKLNGCSITGNANSVSPDESGIELIGLTGTSTSGSNPTVISNTTISNSHEFEMQVTNTSGTLTDFQLVNDTISSNGATGVHGNLVNFLGSGTSTMTLTVNGGTFTGAAPSTGTAIFADTAGTSMNVTVTGGTYTNNNVAVNVSTGPANSALTFDINGITANGNRAAGVNVFQNANAPFARTVNGKIRNNVFGTLGVAGSGSSLGSPVSISNEGAVPQNISVTGNTIQEATSFPAINVGHGISTPGTIGTGTSSLTISSNTIKNIGNRAIVVQDNAAPAAGGGAVCANISGNVFSGISGVAGNGQTIRLRRLTATTFFNVTQKSPTAAVDAQELDDANGTTAALISLAGTITFNQAPCVTAP